MDQSLRKKKIKLRSLFSLPKNSKKFTTQENNDNHKINNNNLNKSASSSDLHKTFTDNEQKYSVFGTIKRNIQNKFSPSRKIVTEENFVPIPVVHRNNNNESQRTLFVEANSNNNEITIPIDMSNNNYNLENNRILSETNPINIVASSKSIEDEAVDNARLDLAKYGWYWGALSRTAAQRTLTGKPNGSFLVRISETDKLQFTLSFRSASVTLHNRINYIEGFWQIESLRYQSIVELFEDTINKSKECVFCYVKPVNRLLPPVPVRLTNPINRYYEVPSLQHLCRFVIRSKLDIESLSKLPIPSKVRAYIQENFYENI